MSKAGTISVPVRLICLNPPPPEYEGALADFGLQDKAQAIHDGAHQPDGSICFSFVLAVKTGPAGAVDFSGPFAHGTRGDRFLYLSWRRLAGTWIKRLKIPLGRITAAQIEQIMRNDGGLTATINGGGAARTEPLGDGWAVYPT